MVLITGASGFVGGALALYLSNFYTIRAPVRAVPKAASANIEYIPGFELTELGNLSYPCRDVHTVIHCAARVHVMQDASPYPLDSFRQANVEGTLGLASQAAKAGVKRFIYLSSIKVNGEATEIGCPFTSDDNPSPVDPYAISKYEAEIKLKALSRATGMELVIIRPPLIYGPGVSANFLSMMSWLYRGSALPLGGLTKNRRSFIYIDNLIDIIAKCIGHPAAANQTFLVSDDEDLSTVEILKRMALALGRPSKLIAVPKCLILLGAFLIGRPEFSQRLCGSLQVDIRKTKEILGWTPPTTVGDGLRHTAEYFLKMQS
jgi:nucleoside-diphosphate-sugar epimerase